MLSVRPAYPRGFYVFGAFVAVFLLVAGAYRQGVTDQHVSTPSFGTSSPHLLAMDLTR